MPSPHTALEKRPLLPRSWSSQIVTQTRLLPSIPQQPNPPSTSEPPRGSAGEGAGGRPEGRGSPHSPHQRARVLPRRLHGQPGRGAAPAAALKWCGPSSSPRRGGTAPPPGPSPEAAPARREGGLRGQPAPRRLSRRCWAPAKFQACPQHKRQGGNNRCKTPHVGKEYFFRCALP